MENMSCEKDMLITAGYSTDCDQCSRKCSTEGGFKSAVSVLFSFSSVDQHIASRVDGITDFSL